MGHVEVNKSQRQTVKKLKFLAKQYKDAADKLIEIAKDKGTSSQSRSLSREKYKEYMQRVERYLAEIDEITKGENS